MFKFKPDPTFVWPVNLSVPGKLEPQVCNFTFRALGRSAFKAWTTEMAEIAAKGEAGNAEGNAKMLERIAAWDVADEGKPVELNLATWTEFLDAYPNASAEISMAFMRGNGEARAKN